MRNFKFLSILLLLSIIVVGCTGAISNDDLDRDEVLNKLEENSKTLRSVSENVEFSMESILSNNMQKMDQDIETVFLYGEEGTITHIHTKQKSVVNEQQQTMEFLKTPESTYINDGNGWQKYSGSENYSTTYKPVMDALLSSKNGMEMKEEKDDYVFYFKGKDAAIFNSMKVPFNISYQGVESGDVDLDISFKISKENMNMENIYIGTSVFLNDSNQSNLSGKIYFFDFNETENIEIPDEVKNN